MYVELEFTERCDHPVECYPCGRKFVPGAVIASAFTNDGETECGVVCPRCLAAGPEEMSENLECRADISRWEADHDERVAAEDITAPTLADLQLMKEIAAL
jgi:hypothetical protein